MGRSLSLGAEKSFEVYPSPKLLSGAPLSHTFPSDKEGVQPRSPRDAGQCHPWLLMLSGAWHYLRGINCTEFCIMYIDSKGVSHTKS